MEQQGQSSIGVANMQEDRTIVLRLCSVYEDGMIAHGYFTYAPADKDYASVLTHLGELRPGQSTAVPPWPDKSRGLP
jgi:hypothetical protein